MGGSGLPFDQNKSRLKVLAVCGTRPDALKMAPVILELKKHLDEVDLSIAVSGQHREMLEQVLRTFELVPDHNLDIMSARQTLAQITTRALEGLDEIMREVQPGLVLAQGDTTTTFVASLAAFYNKIPFGHVEAGLRTDNKYDPFPEEINRRLTGVIADIHFAPTERARQCLLREGIRSEDIVVTGNTVIDALLSVAGRDYVFEDSNVRKALSAERPILVTAHRRENWGEPMRNICAAIKEIALSRPEVSFVFPVHKNPIVRDIVFPELANLDRVVLIEPPDYVPFVHLMKSAYLILTDSGGVQEEAPSLGKPVLVLRKTTERPEGVEAGNAKLVGTDTQNIVREVERLLEDKTAYNTMAQMANPYGDGRAAERIWQAIATRFIS
jgi:UDP-N-acetylglucosamine 2-epimerase (non-hydrolysing)